MSDDSRLRAKLVEGQVMQKYEKMLHPPLTYLGDAFQYRQADGKFNSDLHPHLGQAGAPYAKTVPSKTHPLGALPDPGEIFDRLMAREEGGRNSESGLSSMLIYHATIIIHDIFRTNDKDKNISDISSYLDLSPLYGYNEQTTRQVRDGKYKLGLLKPDTFAEDRLLRQPPGVCIMLVMYNRYHNYAATQIRRINENGRFSVPTKFTGPKLAAMAAACVPENGRKADFKAKLTQYRKVWEKYYGQGDTESSKFDAEENMRTYCYENVTKNNDPKQGKAKEKEAKLSEKEEEYRESKAKEFDTVVCELRALIERDATKAEKQDKPGPIEEFEAAYDAAWNKLDDDLFNTARL